MNKVCLADIETLIQHIKTVADQERSFSDGDQAKILTFLAFALQTMATKIKIRVEAEKTQNKIIYGERCRYQLIYEISSQQEIIFDTVTNTNLFFLSFDKMGAGLGGGLRKLAIEIIDYLNSNYKPI